MNRMTLLLTGGIGSGKSAAAAFLTGRGIPVFDCDAVARTVYQDHPEIVTGLERCWKTPLRDRDGFLDRTALARKIFADPSARTQLEALVHPCVRDDFITWRDAQTASLVAVESAIMLSKPLFDGLYDRVILVEAPEEVRIARVVARSGLSPEAVLMRIRAQSIDRSRADVILRNDGTPADLQQQIDRLIEKLF